MSNESGECAFLCFRKGMCDNREEEDEYSKGLAKFASYEKLSLKKMREDNNTIQRTQSFKKLERPIPTT